MKQPLDKKGGKPTDKPLSESVKLNPDTANKPEDKKDDIQVKNQEDSSKKKAGKAQETTEESKVELEVKYKKLIMGLNKDWEKISVTTSQKIAKNISDELSTGQKEYIDVLSRKFIDFNFLQIRYFGDQLKERLDNLQGLSLFSINKNWQSFTEKCIIILSIVNFPLQKDDLAEFPQEKEFLNQLKSWIGSDVANSIQRTSTDIGSTNQGENQKKVEKKEEKKEV